MKKIGKIVLFTTLLILLLGIVSASEVTQDDNIAIYIFHKKGEKNLPNKYSFFQKIPKPTVFYPKKTHHKNT